MKHAIASVIAVLFLSACGLLPQKATDKIVTGVKTYCAQPLESRLLLRAGVNSGLAGEATIKVQCKGDPAE